MGNPDLFPIATATNNAAVLQSCLLQSPDLLPESVIQRRSSISIGDAYRGVLASSADRIVGFAHQDVYLPRGWFTKVRRAVNQLEADGRRWGVIGVWGISAAGRFFGRVYDHGNAREFESHCEELPVEVASLDEIVLVVNRDSGIDLDPALPSFHLYGTDLALQARKLGYAAYAIDAPIVHNSVRLEWLDSGYAAAYRYMQSKWRDSLPVPTTIIPLIVSPWRITWERLALRRRLRRLLGPTGNISRHGSPAELARRAGYELEEDARANGTSLGVCAS